MQYSSKDKTAFFTESGGKNQPSKAKIHIETNPTLDKQAKKQAQVSSHLISFHATEPK